MNYQHLEEAFKTKLRMGEIVDDEDAFNFYRENTTCSTPGGCIVHSSATYNEYVERMKLVHGDNWREKGLGLVFNTNFNTNNET